MNDKLKVQKSCKGWGQNQEMFLGTDLDTCLPENTRDKTPGAPFKPLRRLLPLEGFLFDASLYLAKINH